MRSVWIGIAAVGVASTLAFVPARREEKKVKRVVRYAETVAPILNRNCVSCHRPGEVAPFSLVGYDNAKKWSKMIAQVTKARQMPPWKAANHDLFLGDKRMSDAEIATLQAWAAAGAPRGDAKKEPPVPTFRSGWTMGEPDLVVGPSKPFKLAAEGTDIYRYFVIPTDFKETRWVRAIDTRPGNKKIVHHVLAFVDVTGAAAKYAEAHADGQEGYTFDGGPNFLPNALLAAWAPGANPHPTPEGTAFELKPGASIVLQVHYNRSGKPEEDLTKVGLYFAKEPPKEALRMRLMDDLRLHLKAGDPSAVKETVFPVPFDATVYAVAPHMHLLGKSMTAELELPDGTKRPLIDLPDWDFRWQMSYWYKEPIKVPAGSKIRFVATYDNSAANPRNPHSPPKEIWWGEATTSEMSMLMMVYSRDGAPSPAK